MPYTPPAPQSPASARMTSPVLSRSSSFGPGCDNSGTRSPQSPRMQLPRSVSSTHYLNKHRRGPGMSQPEVPSFPQSPVEDDKQLGSHQSSIRQSPPPVSSLLIPTGAILSPPDSSENSDGDESALDPTRGRDRGRWGELEQAVRSIELRRSSSPEKDEGDGVERRDMARTSSSEPTTKVHSPLSLNALTPEARKISHSRSSTETAIVMIDRNPYTEPPTEDDSDSDDGELRMKPPLVRKKSGELVKPALRPSSRRRYSSMPGTPTYHKSVHFNDDGNQTRHFLQVDKPSAVSATSSPAETYESETEYPFETKDQSAVTWDIKLANFPEDTYERKFAPVRVERLFLSPDTKSLIGLVSVANIAFQKSVVARFTLDYWKTTSEISAEYDNDVRRQSPSDGYDRFSFSIRLSDQANLENKTLLLCVRYNSGGQEHWDSNNNMNYQIDFIKKMTKSASTSSLALPGSRQKHTIPRSRQSPPATSSRERALETDDDFSLRFDDGASYHFGNYDKLNGVSPTNSIKLKPRTKRAELFRNGSSPSANGLGGRYDFGASLSAALSTAQDKLGKQSGLMPHVRAAAHANSQNYFTREAHKNVKPATTQERPDHITTDRPAMGSEQYKDLVQKFCYFTPGGSGRSSPQHTFTAPQQSGDGALDSTSTSDFSSSRTGSTTPSPPPVMSPSLDGTNERASTSTSTNASAFSSRTASPGPVTGSGYGSFGYPYMQAGYLSDSPTPTAIRG